jgi:polysaccharide deacetylase family protein (PEP-CTERM system associated)
MGIHAAQKEVTNIDSTRKILSDLQQNYQCIRSRPNLLTVDLEDWFHICEVDHLLPREKWEVLPSSVVADTENLLELLNSSECKATFFVLGYVAERHPQLIKRLHAEGHEIAFHGWDHELVYNLTPDDFRLILHRGIKAIEALTGKRPIGFRAPQWSINDRALWAPDILSEEGFTYDSSRAPLKFVGNESYPCSPHVLETSKGSLWEFPPLTLWTPFGRYPAGGGWGLRCLPFTLLVSEVRRLNTHHVPALFFFHPREFGTKRFTSGLSPTKRFVLCARIRSSRAQLSKLMKKFYFTSIEHFLSFQ